MQLKRIQVLGVPVDCLTMDQALALVDELVSTPGELPATLLAVNAEKVITARQDPEVLGFLNNATVLIPDGIGVVWAARTLHLGEMGRVAGCDLMQALCRVAPEKGYRLFLYGARPEVNRAAVSILEQRFPGIRLVGSRDGYVREDEMPELVREINASGADILFVALGSPRQERWMERYRQQLRVKLCMGVGGTFDVIAGTVKRAPKSFQHMHLEWFYRLLMQPKRILRQWVYVVFVLRVLAQKLRG